MITSTHNQKIQLVRALLGRVKDRQQEAAFVVEGVRLVEEALQGGWSFEFALFSNVISPRGQILLENLHKAGVELEEVSGSILNSLAGTDNSQGLLGVVAKKTLLLPKTIDFALILDQVHDPGNLGSLLRSASAAGVQAAFLTPGCVDAFSPKVVRAAMGAHFRFPIHLLNWDMIPENIRGLKFILAEMDAHHSFWQADFRVPLALVIGGEADGASMVARQSCQETVNIPMVAGVESLNASVAGAILMFEVIRQRGQ